MARTLKWHNKEKTFIRVEEGDVVTYVPVEPLNSDYARIVASGETILYDIPDTALADTLDAVTAERDRRINSGFYYNFVVFQSRIEDRENISGAAQLAMMAISAGAQMGNLRWHGGTTDFVWIAQDNSLVPMDAYTVLDFARACASQKQHLIMKARDIKNQISLGATVDFHANSTWS